MSDLIDRQAAIDALRTCYDTEAITHTNGNEYIDYDQALDLINTLPSAQPKQPEQRWIPCSERLPEDEQPILFSTTTGRVHQGRFHRDNSVNRWYSSLDKMRAYNNVVNAWMPLPEPYKGGKHETD